MTLMMLLAFSPFTRGAMTIEPLRIPSGVGTLRLYLHHASSSTTRLGPPVLILHGSTFPSGNAAAWKIDGQSWMDDLAAHGYDVYALDFLGFGKSDRFPEMASEEPNGAALGDVASMVGQVEQAVAALSASHDGTPVNIIAHSAGTLVAGRFAELHPGQVARMVLFGAPSPTGAIGQRAIGSLRYRQITAADQLAAFEPRVREANRLDAEMFGKWTAAYLATDPMSSTRRPASVRVPAGLSAAADYVDQSGRLPYDSAHITTPTLIIQGEWDAVTPPSQGVWLFEHLASNLKRLVLLS
jgi:pimeloyl-ACP methyl ester carboxylesterase